MADGQESPDADPDHDTAADLDHDPDVVVVGGGVVGCAAARTLASHRDVLVLERDRVASGATALAAGEVTMTPSYTDYPTIAAHANEFFRTYDGTGQFAFVESESVELVPPTREGEARRRADRLEADGHPVSFLDPATAGERYPRLDFREFAGGVRYTGTGFLDPYTLTTTLQRDAENRGASFETGVSVTDVVVEGGAVAGVETDRGLVTADHVVVAAGWRTPDLLSGRLRLPVRPYRTQCVVVRTEPALSDRFPMGWVPGEHAYFRREENGDLLVGGWSFAEDDPAAASANSDEAFREHVAELLPRFLRGGDDARFVDGWAGVDAATPDTRPIVDAPDDAPDGLIVATGFHGRGVMTAPVAATLVESFVRGATAPIPTEPFRLDRFESRSADFEFVSISAGDS